VNGGKSLETQGKEDRIEEMVAKITPKVMVSGSQEGHEGAKDPLHK